MKYLKVYESFPQPQGEIKKRSFPSNTTQNGIVLVYGKPDNSGKKKLYYGHIKYLPLQLSRKNKDNKKIQDDLKITFTGELKRIIIKDGKLSVGSKIPLVDPYLERVGMRSSSISLNDQKTPRWWETITTQNIGEVFKKLGNSIESDPLLDLS